LRWVSAIDSKGREIWIVDAHRDDGRRFVVHADEILSAFVELERQVLTVTFFFNPFMPNARMDYRKRASRRKAFLRACGLKADCVCRIGIGDSEKVS